MAVPIYVDDVLTIGQDETNFYNVKQALDQAFTIKDLGHARYFLGIEVSSSYRGTFFNQRKYILTCFPIGPDSIKAILISSTYWAESNHR